MNVAVFGKTEEHKRDILHEIKKNGFTQSKTHPDIVISYGGDGAFLESELRYPGIPKVLFRASKICNKCHNIPIAHALELLAQKTYDVQKHIKLEARTRKQTLNAVNDIVIRNVVPTHAIRFVVSINGQKTDELIGDGIVVSTPFGSTAYFHSITGTKFKNGIGIAFNNTTMKKKPLILSEQTRVTVTITRGTAHLCADNNPHMFTIHEGEKIIIKKSAQYARIISF